MTEVAVDESTVRSKWKRWGWWLVKLGVILVVVAGVTWNIREAARKLGGSEIELRPGWLLLAGVAYFAGWLPSAVWWWWVMRALGGRPHLMDAVRAYYVGHLGKYVPGKAMVVVIRCGLMHGRGVRAALAAVTAVYETLSSMAVGALVAAGLLAIVIGGRLDLTLLAVGLMAVAGLPILPSVFNRLVKRIAVPLQGGAPQAIPPLSYRAVGCAVAGLALGWGLHGVSLGATIQGITEAPVAWSSWPLWTASAALATVSGFLSFFLPGGLGVRELVLMELLPQGASGIGKETAVVAAVVLRLVWVASEVVWSAVLYFAVRASSSPEMDQGEA